MLDAGREESISLPSPMIPPHLDIQPAHGNFIKTKTIWDIPPTHPSIGGKPKTIATQAAHHLIILVHSN